MNTIITITKGGVISRIMNIPLEKRLYDLHPDATSRITVFSDYTKRRFTKEQILNVAGFRYCLDHVVQVIEYTGRRNPRFLSKPTYFKYEIDLKF